MPVLVGTLLLFQDAGDDAAEVVPFGGFVPRRVPPCLVEETPVMRSARVHPRGRNLSLAGQDQRAFRACGLASPLAVPHHHQQVGRGHHFDASPAVRIVLVATIARQLRNPESAHGPGRCQQASKATQRVGLERGDGFKVLLVFALRERERAHEFVVTREGLLGEDPVCPFGQRRDRAQDRYTFRLNPTRRDKVGFHRLPHRREEVADNPTEQREVSRREAVGAMTDDADAEGPRRSR